MTVMGFPKYKITEGKIFFNGKDITETSMHERARMGIGIMLQKPPAIKGVTLRKIINFLLSKREDKNFNEIISSLKLEDFLDRDINYKFSGGEIKKAELLQLLAQRPKLSLIDEPESGVDVDNIKLVGELIRKLLEKDKHILERKASGLIITHTGEILDFVRATYGHMIIEGKLICSSNPREIFDYIKEHGYKECEECPAKILKSINRNRNI